MKWLTSFPRNDDEIVRGIRQFFTPGAARFIEGEYEQFRSGEYRVTRVNVQGMRQLVLLGVIVARTEPMHPPTPDLGTRKLYSTS